MFSPEESAFIERIREDHTDDLPRLIYADWLDELGEHARADFIRVQCALEGLDDRDASGDHLREYECSLLEKHAREWAAGIGELVEGYSFRRGMIEAVTVNPGQFLAIGEDGFRRFPIRRFRFVDMGVDVAKIFRSPLTRFISELDFSQCTLDQISCVSIAKSKHLRNLHLLDLGFTAIDHWGLSILMNSPVVGPLRSLRLNENRTLDSTCLGIVLRSQQSGLLASIDLTGNLLNCAALEPLLNEYQSLPGLRSVNWEGNLIGQGMRQFVQSPLFSYLCVQNPVLNLASNEIDAHAMRELTKCEPFSHVRQLILDHNAFRDSGFSHLIEIDHPIRLESLSLVQCGLQEESILQLAKTEWLGQLRELDLRGNVITVESLDRLREAHANKSNGGKLILNADRNLPNTRPASSPRWAIRPVG